MGGEQITIEVKWALDEQAFNDYVREFIKVGREKLGNAGLNRYIENIRTDTRYIYPSKIPCCHPPGLDFCSWCKQPQALPYFTDPMEPLTIHEVVRIVKEYKDAMPSKFNQLRGLGLYPNICKK